MCFSVDEYDAEARNHIDRIAKDLGGKVSDGFIVSYALGKLAKGLVAGATGDYDTDLKLALASMDFAKTPFDFEKWLKDNFNLTPAQEAEHVKDVVQRKSREGVAAIDDKAFSAL